MDYLSNRSDEALDILIRRSESALTLTPQQHENLTAAKHILAERSAAKVKAHFDIPRAIAFLTIIAREKRLCSYKELALACINNPKVEWSTYYRKIGGRNGLMQSIIRHCAAHGLPQLPSLVVRQDEVKLGPDVLPNREGEAEYGFKRGMIDEGLAEQGVDTDALVLEHRQACFVWPTD
tara:strand:+ start:1446 stop:1982 length:537 start_codon:yes stop_codon:yes gene_type:complete